MNIPLELSGKIKKPEFKVFFYDLIYNKIEENSLIFIYIEHKFELRLPYTSYPDYYIITFIFI